MNDAPNANNSPTTVQTLGESPVDANTRPIFCKYGFNESRKLFSKISPRFLLLLNSKKTLSFNIHCNNS